MYRIWRYRCGAQTLVLKPWDPWNKWDIIVTESVHYVDRTSRIGLEDGVVDNGIVLIPSAYHDSIINVHTVQ